MRVGTVLFSSILVLLSTSTPVAAQSPWGDFSLFRRVEADPNQDYRLTAENGPWMIMAATFSGQSASYGASPQEVAVARQSHAEAEAQARELVLELRSKYKLEAYLYEMTFDNTRDVAQGAADARGAKRLRYKRPGNERSQQIAVVVGNYDSIDSRQAKADLATIKDIEPEALSLPKLHEQGRKTFQQLVGLRLAQKVLPASAVIESTSNEVKNAGVEINNVTRQYGPMGSAMLTRNPLRPDEPTDGGAIDKLVWDMNKEVPNSLLECPGAYTVKVATFNGSVIVDQAKIRQIEEGELKVKSRLTRAAEDAHRLAEALQVLGYEAYEFHDRFASMVTVGSFDTPGTRRPDGKIEINPKAHQYMKTFGAHPVTGKPQEIIGIPLDVQPVMVVVPKRSFASDYSENGP